MLSVLCLLLPFTPSAAAASCDLATLTASDGVIGDRFGYTVSLSGDLALVGSYQDEGNELYSGSAFVYFFDGSS